MISASPKPETVAFSAMEYLLDFVDLCSTPETRDTILAALAEPPLS